VAGFFITVRAGARAAIEVVMPDQRKSGPTEQFMSAWPPSRPPSLNSATLQQAVDLLGKDVSTLRVWRKEPSFREQVRLLRERLADERFRCKCLFCEGVWWRRSGSNARPWGYESHALTI
jgi:hypothetical protein